MKNTQRRPSESASAERATVAARAADGKGGGDALVLDVGDVLSIVEWFVITSGASSRQVRTIAEEVEDQVKRSSGSGPLRTEGLYDARWVLLDFGDIVVHVFLDEVRQHYQLERLWGDVPRLDWRTAGGANGRLAAEGDGRLAAEGDGRLAAEGDGRLASEH